MKLITPFMLLFCTWAMAEIPAEIKQEIDLRVQHQVNPSIVLGVYEQGQSHFYTQGMQNKELGLAANQQSVYEIGSISKTFTALLLAKQVQEGVLKLDDPVQDQWPQPFELTDDQQRAITLKQLATHTSGLPRLPGNLLAFSQDPYANYDRPQLIKGVEMAQPVKSDSPYGYSNFGAGLLGETLAVKSGQSYNDLIQTKILNPLQMQQTYMTLDTVPDDQLAQGYMGNRPAQAWNFSALAGAGSIRSSIEDLLAYGVAHLDTSEGAMQAAMQLAMRNHSEQQGFAVGLGWHITSSGLIWHNGGTAGFRSILVIDPQQQKVAAAITNHNNNSVEDIAFHWIDPKSPLTDHEFPVAIEVKQMQQYTGQFNQTIGDNQVEVELRDEALFFKAPKQPKYKMTYLGEDTFKLNLAKVKLKFNRSEGQVDGFELQGWGDPQTYQKTAK